MKDIDKIGENLDNLLVNVDESIGIKRRYSHTHSVEFVVGAGDDEIFNGLIRLIKKDRFFDDYIMGYGWLGDELIVQVNEKSSKKKGY